VAAHIAAIMPHSPAKEGPLSRPITFDYIGDNFAGMAGRLKRLASDSAGRIADVLSGANARIPAFAGGGLAGLSGGGGSGQPVTVINHFEINGAQLDAKQIIDEAERFRRKRSFRSSCPRPSHKRGLKKHPTRSRVRG